MKKIFALFISLVMVLSFAACGKNSVVGVYTTDSWNGQTATLVLYEDGTCQYPSGGNATWVLQENTVLITIESCKTVDDGSINRIDILFDASLSEVEAKAKATSIAKMDNVESIDINENSDHIYSIALIKAETDNKTLNALKTIAGVKILQQFPTVIDTTEHEAKIMEKGLVLHGHFFEKASN